MGRANIEKRNLWYALTKIICKFWHNCVYYRKVISLGKENINYKENLIFAPNHQNALMDALALLFTLDGQPVFLARADIFKKKFIASILYFLKILPVFRIRDGFGSLKENGEIFNKTIDVISNKNGLVILPEGNHAGFRRLRQLKKGIFRIAFQADEATGHSLPLRIVPVGLEYSHYQRYRQVLTVVYGQPIDIAEYRELYYEKPEIALNAFRERLACEIKKLIVHIESEDDYEAINELRSIINEPYVDYDSNNRPKLIRDRELIDKLNNCKECNPQLYRTICNKSLYVANMAKQLKLGYRELHQKSHSILWAILGIISMVITLPISVVGAIFDLILFGIPYRLTRKIKDPQFRSSVKYGVVLVLGTFLSLLTLTLLLVFVRPFWLAISIFFALPIMGQLAWLLYEWFQKIVATIRIRIFKAQKNSNYIQLINNFNDLNTLVNQL